MILVELQRSLESLRQGRQREDVDLLDEMLSITSAWLRDETPPANLMSTLERYVGHVWFSTDELHSDVVRVYEAFGKTVASLGGMTMNERLFIFGLMDSWDRAGDEDQNRIRKKLLAPL